MHSLQESVDFDQFELIPRHDPLIPPKIDSEVQLKTKILTQKHESENTDDNKTQADKQWQKIIKEKEGLIKQLEQQLQRIEGLGKFQKQANIIYTEVFSKITQFLGKPEISIEDLPKEIMTRVSQLTEEIKDLKQRQTTRQSECQSQTDKNKTNINRSGDIMSKVIKEKQETIKKLRSQLLKSTQNNINAIFHTQLTAQECLSKEVLELRAQVEMLKNPGFVRGQKEQPNITHQQCPHHEKISILIKNYEQMLEEYRRNDRIVADLQSRQEEAYSYFSALRAELTHTVQVTCNNYSDKRLNELESRIQDALNGLSIPQKVKTEGDNDIRIKQLLNEIDRLNQKLTNKEVQIYEMKKKLEEEAGLRSWNAYQSHVSQMTTLEQQIKEKDQRIYQLENTIIDQIDTRKRLDSHGHESEVRSIGTVNSQQSDFEKQKNNIRNLKTLVSELKKENKALKLKLKDATMNSDGDQILEKINRDQSELKLMEEVLTAIIDGNHQRCECLERITDTFLRYKEEIPELEDLLMNFGVMRASSTVLAEMEYL